MVTPPIETNVARVADALINGQLVVFLGAGANLCDRPDGWHWQPHQKHLPSGIELSQHLVGAFHMNDPRSPADDWQNSDLARVAQAVVMEMGDGRLKHELHALLDDDYPPTALHHLLAGLPGRLRRAHFPCTSDQLLRRLLIISTNYDDLQERAFVDAGQPFHTLRYQANGPKLGKFLYRSPAGGEERAIRSPRQFTDILADEHPVLMKFHGGINRENQRGDSFVITEDDYIEYLARTASAVLIPAPVPAMLKQSHVLFLGHALRDWNLRVIFHQLWAERDATFKWWAIQLKPRPLEQKSWSAKGVDILESSLNDYVDLLDWQLRALGV